MCTRLLPVFRASPSVISSLISSTNTLKVIRQFSVTAVQNLRKVVEETSDNVTVIEGQHAESSRTNTLMKVPGPEGACPLCRLNLDLKYTDVLILSQFLREDGCLLPRRVTGICKTQQKKLELLVHQAQRAGLMPNLRPTTRNGLERTSTMSNYKWKKYNVYFTEAIE